MVMLVGGSSQLGCRIAAALARAGVPFRVAGPDPAALQARLTAAEVPADRVTEVLSLDPGDPAALAAVLAAGDVLIHADPSVPPATVQAAAARVVAQGAHHLDTVAHPGHAAAVTAALDAKAQRAEVSVLPALGADLVPGEALAELAAEAVAPARELHVSYAVPGLPGVLTPGGRRAWAAARVATGEVRERGRMLPESLGEARRLAWFPRPIGPTHAAGVPGQLPWAVARRQPEIATARTYLALPGWRAEWLQLTGGAARWPRVRRRLEARLAAGGTTEAERLAAVRWACVAEAQGADDRVARAWANGTDPLAVVAAVVADLVVVLRAGGSPAGVHPPGAILPATALLDGLAASVGLRWSVVRPG